MDRKRIGLALSGGVARGPAHVGVLTVLDREAIPIDCIAGASAGALVGALYCAGISITRATELLQHFGWREIASPVWPNRGFVSFAKLESWLQQLVGDIQFSDLKKPLAVVATDLNTGRPVVFRDGPVIPAVHASCAVPGFVQSVALDGRLLGDGGASANLPVMATRALGADIVVGVDLFLPNSWQGWGPLGIGMVALENLIRQSGGGLDQADLLITPELSGSSYFRFGHAKAMLLKGQLAAEAKLAELKALIAAPPCEVVST